ncbi:hypothetical protein [Peribacillus frigoritolerans]|uniref:hypothetical protein n=1 Tax=Peribacillus frigoritolerans TaxID=450367 RepID=UPI002161BB69|nr:hypothetical protein [Peribacillus frigoritolerans]
MILNQDRVIHVYFFTVLAKLTGLKKFATLLPNNWLAETPQTLALMRLGRQSAERERISEIDYNFYHKKSRRLQSGKGDKLPLFFVLKQVRTFKGYSL